MNKKDISQKTLAAIKNKGIKPKSKWSFVLRDLLLIVVGGLSLLIATMSFGMMVYHFLESDIDLYAQKGPRLGWFVLSTFPYLCFFLRHFPYYCLLIIIFLAFIAYIIITNFTLFIDSGYRLPLWDFLSFASSLDG